MTVSLNQYRTEQEGYFQDMVEQFLDDVHLPTFLELNHPSVMTSAQLNGVFCSGFCCKRMRMGSLWKLMVGVVGSGSEEVCCS